MISAPIISSKSYSMNASNVICCHVVFQEQCALVTTRLITHIHVVYFVGTFTIFAPTDAAFDAVGTETELLKDTAALANILKYHVVKGIIPSSAAKNELQLETLAGTKIRFNIYSHNHVRLFIDFIYIFKKNVYFFCKMYILVSRRIIMEKVVML